MKETNSGNANAGASTNLQFTLCQTPIVYHQANDSRLVISRINAEPEERDDLMLTSGETETLFARTGQIGRIDVFYSFQKKE